LQQLAAMANCRDSDHPIAEGVLGLGNHIPEVDPDPELDPVHRRGPRVALPPSPRCISTAHRTASTTLANSARKPVAGILNDPAPILSDLRLDQCPEVMEQMAADSMVLADLGSAEPRDRFPERLLQ
jgi:hypothetical protein